MDRHLVVFVRAPRLGAGKTRLARGIGAVAAWRFHRLMTAAILRRLCSPRWLCHLAVTPDGSGPWPGGWRVTGQGRGDLGRRMARLLRRLPPGPVVIVGSDIPELAASHIDRAFRLLGSHDAVFGPAADGGYWLVGLRRRPRLIDPFRDVRWSSEHALADSLRPLQGCRVAMLESLEDVDDAADYARWRGREAACTGDQITSASDVPAGGA